MKLCEVLGTVVSTVHHHAFDGQKLMVVQEIDPPTGQRHGKSYLAVDTVQAGVGDRVLVLSEGTGVRQIMQQEIWPIRSLIVGIVDQVFCEHSGPWYPSEVAPTEADSVLTRGAG